MAARAGTHERTRFLRKGGSVSVEIGHGFSANLPWKQYKKAPESGAFGCGYE